MNAASLPMLWVNCVERLKDRVNNRSFWEALEATRPVTIENGALILGMDSGDFNKASVLQQVSNLHIINETVSQMFNQPLQVRVIEGMTLDDWEAAKELDARVTAMRQTAPAPRSTASGSSWDGIIEQISRLYAQAPFRALPQGKARYANEALYLLVEAMDTLYSDEADDQTERSLARVLDRIANASEIPAAVLAFELERLRAWRKASAEA